MSEVGVRGGDGDLISEDLDDDVPGRIPDATGGVVGVVARMMFPAPARVRSLCVRWTAGSASPPSGPIVRLSISGATAGVDAASFEGESFGGATSSARKRSTLSILDPRESGRCSFAADGVGVEDCAVPAIFRGAAAFFDGSANGGTAFFAVLAATGG